MKDANNRPTARFAIKCEKSPCSVSAVMVRHHSPLPQIAALAAEPDSVHQAGAFCWIRKKALISHAHAKSETDECFIGL